MSLTETSDITRRIPRQRKRVQIVKILVDGVEVDGKECTKCGVVKELGLFHKKDNCLGGVYSICKQCRLLIAKSYRELNQSEVKISNRRWRERNREYIQKINKEYYISNRTRLLAEMRIKDKERGYSRNYRLANLEQCRKKDRDYAKNNPTKVKVKNHRRRTRKSNLPHMPLTERMVKCALTGRRENVTIEHFIPLSIGHGGTYDGNVYPLVSLLNYSKWKRNAFEWLSTRPDIDSARFDAVVAYLAELNGLTPSEFRSYVDWCYANPRTIDEIERNNETYGYVVSSLELWRAATGMQFPLRIDFDKKPPVKRRKKPDRAKLTEVSE